MRKVFLQLFKRQSNAAIKIILLALGLAMGLVLIAKVYYERVYDNYMDDSDRVYIVMSDYTTSDGARSYDQTPGAIAPGIKAYSPSVEAATRTTSLAKDLDCSLVDKNGMLSQSKFLARSVALADTSFFELFTRTITGNDPKKTLDIKDHIYISESMAEKLSPGNHGDLIGAMLTPTYVGQGSIKFVIDGIYDDFPDNSSFASTDIIVSMPSIGNFMWDGTNNWVGNDRYRSYVKLIPGSSPQDIEKGIAQMCEKNLPLEGLEKSGTKINFRIEPLDTYNIENSEVAKVCLMLLIMALVVLVASILNYVLIALSAMVHKTKMVAVRKCYGASPSSIYRMVFAEAFVHFLLSLLLCCLILYMLRSNVEQLIGASLTGMLTGGSVVVLTTICAIVFIFCGLLPGMVYSKIPVAMAFRRYKESSRRWNLVLLFAQFAMSAFFISILAVMVMQYNRMLNSDPGYEYKNTLIVKLGSAYEGKKDLIREEITRLPSVEATSSCENLPIIWPSGNNVGLPGDDKEYFNVADMYFAGDGYFELLGIPIIEGRNFTQDQSVTNEIMVSRSFVEKIVPLAGWKDGAVGKSVLITEHSQGANDIFTICGVYEDYLIGSYEGQDKRPSVQFYGGLLMEGDDEYKNRSWLLVKLKELTQANIAAVQQVLTRVNPDGDAKVTPYSAEVVDMYKESRKVKDSIAIAGLIVLLITIIGLLGYTEDEINRRRSEIAVRKINGASLGEILILFLKNVIRLALPAAIIGCLAAYFASSMMMELYTMKVALSWWIFALCGLAIIFIVSAVVVLRTYSAANANPVKNLKTE